MAPSSPTNAPTRKPPHLNVIHEGIFKKDSEIRPHISARQRTVPLATNVHDEGWSNLPSADASNTPEWATGMDEDSIERPEDICELSGDEWDLEEAGWSDIDCGAAEKTAPVDYIQIGDATPADENVWNEAEASERTDQIDDLLHLLENDTAAPSSDIGDDAAGIWAAPQGCIF
jgi:hypothetical protein